MSAPPWIWFRSAAGVLLAAVCLLLAAVGVVLPGLPTTPFVLLASWLLLRSAPRMAAVLAGSRLFGPVLRDWNEHRAITLRVRRWAVGTVIASVAGMMLLSPVSWSKQLFVVAMASVGIRIILRIPIR